MGICSLYVRNGQKGLGELTEFLPCPELGDYYSIRLAGDVVYGQHMRVSGDIFFHLHQFPPGNSDLGDHGESVEYTHHEVANSQHEIDLRYADAMTMADRVITYKLVVKHVAGSHGLHASFMPKPIAGINGNGMHVHQSLFKDGRNVFFDPKTKDFLSETARHFVAGILRHAREICVVTNQWVNSYKRLIPGYEAPVYISWGRRNRSALVRIPQAKLGYENATRIECRFPDPSCNPYLAFSIMLAAGLEGIKKKYPLSDSVEANIFEMKEIERRAKRIETLPGSLIEAIETAEKSALLRNTFGEHVFSKFLENKRLEWDHYRTQVSDYEIKRYLPML